MVNTGPEFVRQFANVLSSYGDYGYWLQEKEIGKGYTGYDEKLREAKFLKLSWQELQNMDEMELIPEIAKNNIKENNDQYEYLIRLYKKDARIFPEGLKSFRVSVCQSAVNFPPVIAKAIWERYTEEFKNDETVYVWDPSSGWGGRILGAMAIKDDRNIKYLGCDPNTDHTISVEYSSGGYGMPDREMLWTKYDDLAKFYNTETSRSDCLFPHNNKWEVWQLGSEEMQNDKKFQKYKGKLSVVFTSPPYFSKEVYSQDKAQSCHKFNAYEDWKNGFLYETLKTAYEWLRPGGYIVWNIADVKMGKDLLPLEKDSCDIMKQLGMEYVETMGLVLAQMPGAGRTKEDEEGNIISTNKNQVKIDGKLFRYEPIWVFKKP
jgi:hypothetical protein